MKRFQFILSALLALFCTGLHAQDSGSPDASVFDNIYLSLACLAAGIVLVTEMALKLLPGAGGPVKQIVSWAIGIAITLIGWRLDAGFLSGLAWYIALLYALAASLIANGVADTGLVQWLIGLLSPKGQEKQY